MAALNRSTAWPLPLCVSIRPFHLTYPDPPVADDTIYRVADWAHAVKSSTTGLKVRFFKVKIATGLICTPDDRQTPHRRPLGVQDVEHARGKMQRREFVPLSRRLGD
jgi:hypothetical protein